MASPQVKAAEWLVTRSIAPSLSTPRLSSLLICAGLDNRPTVLITDRKA